jgi:transcriptional regulator with XRE-family HTH domain
MSTLSRNMPSPFTDVPCGKRFVVKTEQSAESLADYVRRMRHEKDLSLADVSERSGNRIGRTHINRIENGELTNVGFDKLRALAKGLGVPEEEVFAVARGKSVSGDPDLEEIRLLEYFRTLPQDSREVLLAYAEMMSIRAGGKGRRMQLDTPGVDAARQRDKKRA